MHIKKFFLKKELLGGAVTTAVKAISFSSSKTVAPDLYCPQSSKKVAKCGSTMLVAFFTLFQIHKSKLLIYGRWRRKGKQFAFFRENLVRCWIPLSVYYSLSVGIKVYRYGQISQYHKCASLNLSSAISINFYRQHSAFDYNQYSGLITTRIRA